MADIRCPMCGKPNPENLDTCQFCQARLKPLIASSPSDDPIIPEQPESSSELPDWLDFDSDADLDKTEDDAPFEDEADDWMTRLGGASESEESSLPQADPEAEIHAASRMDFNNNGIPDWLEDMDADRTTPPLGTSQESSDTELPSRLSDDEEVETPEAIEESSDLPDWLSGLGAQEEDSPEDDAPSSASVPPFAADDDLPDWLTESSDDEISTPSGVEGDLPDWLSDMDGDEMPHLDEPIPLQDLKPAVSDDDSDLPDWLAADDEGETPSAVPSEAGDLVDDASGYVGQETIPIKDYFSSDEAAPALESEDADLPDWLSDGAEETEGLTSAAEGDLPEWLSGMDDVEAAPLDGEPPAPGAEDADLPDWLADLSAQEEAQAKEAPKPQKPFDIDTGALYGLLAEDSDDLESPPTVDGELPEQQPDLEPQAPSIADVAPQQESVPNFSGVDDDSLPDWLSGEGEEEAESAVPAAAEDDLPDWLSDSVAGVAGAAVIGTVAGAGSSEEAVEAISSVEEDLPDWLSDIDGVVEMPESEPDLPPSTVDESRAVPDWLHDSEVSLPVSGDEVEAEPVETTPLATGDDFEDDLFEMDQLPDWISDEPQSDLDQPQETGSVDGLEPSELPGWLAAMRPIESAASDAAGAEQRGPMENAGPLAGLYGVLAAEPDISRLKKPPVYSSKLHITDAQQAHANVLRELLETENQPQAIPLPPLLSSQRVFRIVLSAIMVVIAFIAVFAGSEIATMPTPGNIPSGVEQTRNLVNSLSLDDTALIAFDYEPGLAGEMEAAAAAVVDHMMLKGAKLVLVSTSPTGPALAERFINDVQGNHGYISGSQYVNLGYVPGGVTGLGAFARTPQWVFPDTLNGEPAWETEPLKNVARISDFALVVLITDNPNTARAWVEQVNPELGAVPLVALVSAQAEPMVRPYFDNQQTQIDGLVSGLTGGAAYEVMTRPNVARTYWDAFNIVLIVAVSAILIGGFITVISTLLAQRKESEGESA